MSSSPVRGSGTLQELFDIVIIVPVREVLLVGILLELLPHDLSVIDLPHFLEVLPPYGFSSIHIEDGNLSLMEY